MAAIPAPSPTSPVTLSVPWRRIERFIELLTHDLRNGLNAIELQLTLLSEISDDPEVKTEVKRVRGSVADLTRQLQAVRLATAGPQTHVLDYPAADFVEDLRERLDRERPDATARVLWEIEAGKGSLAIDPALSMTALLELLGNALHFAREGTTVRVRAVGGPSGLIFSITETLVNPPVDSPADWGHSPLSSTRRDRYGLGTFRARRITEAVGGSLRFDYAEGDQSLTASVVLPAAAPEDPPV